MSIPDHRQALQRVRLKSRKLKRDIVLLLFSTAICIIFFLLEKTAAVVILCLMALFGLLAVVLCDWVREKTQRGISLLVLGGCTIGFGFLVWPADKLTVEMCPHRLSVSRNEHDGSATITIRKAWFGRRISRVTIYTRFPIGAKINYPSFASSASSGHMANGLAYADFRSSQPTSKLELIIPVEAEVVCADQQF